MNPVFAILVTERFADPIVSLPPDAFRKREPVHLRSAITGKIGSAVTNSPATRRLCDGQKTKSDECRRSCADSTCFWIRSSKSAGVVRHHIGNRLRDCSATDAVASQCQRASCELERLSSARNPYAMNVGENLGETLDCSRGMLPANENYAFRASLGLHTFLSGSGRSPILIE